MRIGAPKKSDYNVSYTKTSKCVYVLYHNPQNEPNHASGNKVFSGFA